MLDEPEEEGCPRWVKKTAVFTSVGAIVGAVVALCSDGSLPWYDYIVIWASIAAFLSWIPSDG